MVTVFFYKAPHPSSTLPFKPIYHRIAAMQKANTKKNNWVSWSEDEVKLLKRLFPPVLTDTWALWAVLSWITLPER
jgi:hypothetical protein